MAYDLQFDVLCFILVPSIFSSCLLLVDFNDVILFHLQCFRGFVIIDTASIKQKSKNIYVFKLNENAVKREFKTYRRDVIGTPTLSAYDFFSFPICVVCLTRK